MVRLGGPPDSAAIRAGRGVIDYWQQWGVWYSRGWPRRTSIPRTAGEEASSRSFTCIARWTGRVSGSVRAGYLSQPRSEGQTWVDVFRETAAGKSPLGVRGGPGL